MMRGRVLVTRSVALALLTLGATAALGQYAIDWHTIDGGGGTSVSGDGVFRVSGTIGQPDAGVLSGGSFRLVGGFWAVTLPNGELTGDLNCDGAVNFDDIEAFVTALIGQAAYETNFPDCRWLNGDIDGDGIVTFDDIEGFVVCLIHTACP